MRKKPVDGNGNGAQAIRERVELQQDGLGKGLADAGDVIAAAQAATTNEPPTTPAEPQAPHTEERMTDITPAAPEPEPAKNDDPIATLLKQAKGGVAFARSQMTPPKHGSGKSRAERFGLKDDLAKAVDTLQGWIDIVPSIVEAKGNMDPEQFRKSIEAFESTYNHLQGVLDELSVRRCEANVDSIEKGLAIIRNPKWKGPTTDLTDVTKVLADLKRVVKNRKPWPRVNERGDDAARNLWKAIEGRCYTCGSQLPREFHGHFCDDCHTAFEKEKKVAAQQQQVANADLLTQLRAQLKKPQA